MGGRWSGVRLRFSRMRNKAAPAFFDAGSRIRGFRLPRFPNGSSYKMAVHPRTAHRPPKNRVFQRSVRIGGTALLATLCTMAAAAQEPPDAAALYREHCSECHGAGRLGAMGPALLPQNLKRLSRNRAAEVIRNGAPATQMPAFHDRLDSAAIDSLVEYIYTPLKRIPAWGVEQMRASHVVYHPPGSLPPKPRFSADLQNLFVVVELGDHHATLLDGDTFTPIHRFPTRFALHGGPKYSNGGRYVFFASRDGWISKFDIYNLEYVAEIRAGINSRNVAVSADGRYVMVANYLPHTLVLLDGSDLAPLRIIPASDGNGHSSRVSAVYAAEPRNSFIVALKDIPELWEIPYPADAARAGAGPLPIRRIRTSSYLDDFFINQEYTLVIGTSRDGSSQVVDLEQGKVTHTLDLPGMPHLGSGISWIYRGRPVLATPNMKHGIVSVVDMTSWKTIRRIETLGPGFFMRSHENTPYAWVDVFFGPNRDAVHVIDKRTLEIVKTLRPAPGKTSAHVEFTRDGTRALLSIWDPDGAVIVYDSRTLKELKRIPMRKPSGKYNVHNKLSRSAGTSH